MKNEDEKEKEEKFKFLDDDSKFEESTKEEEEKRQDEEKKDDKEDKHEEFKEEKVEKKDKEEKNKEKEEEPWEYKHVEAESNDTSSTISNDIGKGIYLSYEMRVAIMVVSALLFLGIASGLLLDAFTYNESEIIDYSENSNVDYKVCLEENTDYSESCLGQNMQYLSLITKNIPVTFNYDVKLSKAKKYDIDYYVVGSLRIVDRDNEEKVLYTSEDVLVPNTKVSNEADNIQFTSNIEVDFKQYNNYVTSYKSRYSLNADAYLDVVLYLNESTGPRRVSSLTVPLGVQTYGISKSQTLNNNQSFTVKEEGWKSRNIFDVVIGLVMLLIAIGIIIRVARLMIKVSNSKSKYQRKLSQILREYDRIIVVARNGFEMNPNKKLIKVLSFNELLDARDTLEKPIVYVKVNEVKSEFYVEDVDKVYQYVMKDADF